MNLKGIVFMCRVYNRYMEWCELIECGKNWIEWWFDKVKCYKFNCFFEIVGML